MTDAYSRLNITLDMRDEEIATLKAELGEIARLWQSGCRDGMIAANWGCFSVEMDRIAERYGKEQNELEAQG